MPWEAWKMATVTTEPYNICKKVNTQVRALPWVIFLLSPSAMRKFLAARHQGSLLEMSRVQYKTWWLTVKSPIIFYGWVYQEDKVASGVSRRSACRQAPTTEHIKLYFHVVSNRIWGWSAFPLCCSHLLKETTRLTVEL